MTPAVEPIPELWAGDPGEAIFPNSEYASSGKPEYRVWYGTNRKPVDPHDQSRGYSADHDTHIHYGTLIVSIPKTHKFGSIGSSWVYRLVTWQDDRLKIEHIQPDKFGNFFSDMQYKLSTRQPGERTALVYIHGYNTTFEEAAIRAAQIGFDLKVEGVTTFFSWPSSGETHKYWADEATIGASEPFLEEFLRRILLESGAEEVNVIAHSMGNRGLLRVMQNLSKDPTMKFGQIILAAPDVDTRLFENLAVAYPKVSDRTTLYVSSKDLALKGSGIIHDYPRAGFKPPITVVNGITTIEVSDIDLTVLGHRYFAEAAAVLYDMYQLMASNSDPEQRIRLTHARNADGELYYRIIN
jgi:esterase/lipase superfamily enzyme